MLLGLPYRLGANPDDHKAADCVSLAREVLKNYGIESPVPTRDWYRPVSYTHLTLPTILRV